VSDWHLARPANVPGQSIGQADYVLIAEIVEVDRFEQQGSEPSSVRLDALLPGWVGVVRVDGEPKWSCPVL
jgi:hypothetical protein